MTRLVISSSRDILISSCLSHSWCLQGWQTDQDHHRESLICCDVIVFIPLEERTRSSSWSSRHFHSIFFPDIELFCSYLHLFHPNNDCRKRGERIRILYMNTLRSSLFLFIRLYSRLQTEKTGIPCISSSFLVLLFNSASSTLPSKEMKVTVKWRCKEYKEEKKENISSCILLLVLQRTILSSSSSCSCMEWRSEKEWDNKTK